MKIAVFANEIAQKGNFGVKVYSAEILRNILRIDAKNSYIFYSNADISSFFCEDVHFSVIKPRKFWAFTSFPRQLKKDKPDALFMPIQVYPFWKKSDIKTVAVVHDLAFLLFPEHFTLKKRKLLAFHTKRAVLLSDKIITPSESTKNDILKFYKVNESKISVVNHGFSDHLTKLADVKTSEVIRLTNGNPYVLFVGSFQPRKNIERLVEVFEEVRKKQKKLKLVLCGGDGWMSEGIYNKIENSPESKNIIVVRNAPDDLLAGLYKNALFFVFPSLYEGFGLPILEAMSFGLPVACARNSSISEVAGDAALFFDEYRISDMAEKILSLCEDEAVRLRLSKKSTDRLSAFSWEKAARATVETIENL